MVTSATATSEDNDEKMQRTASTAPAVGGLGFQTSTESINMVTIGFVKDGQTYATLRGWLHLSKAYELCSRFNTSLREHRWCFDEDFGTPDCVIVIGMEG